VQAQKQYVRRLQPRENVDVNGWWMCDHGRNDIGYINDKNRVLLCKEGGHATLNIQEVCRTTGEKLAAYAKKDAGSVAALFSPWLTVEEMATLKAPFTATLGSLQLGLLAQTAGQEEIFPGFKIEADKNPNRAGAKLIFGAAVEAQTEQILGGIRSGKIKALYLIAGMPHYTPPQELLDVLPKLELLVVQDILNGPLTAAAHVVLPGASFAEKKGVFVNSQNRAQVLRRAIDPLGSGHDDLSLLQRIAKAAGDTDAKLVSSREVFRRLGETHPEFAGMTHVSLGAKGAVVQAK
jgi:NADH-quinone oxidoreductase subunit G